MARVNVYLPDDLAQQARASGVSVSAVTQAALRTAIAGADTDSWLDRVEQIPSIDVSHDSVLQALDDARAELGG